MTDVDKEIKRLRRELAVISRRYNRLSERFRKASVRWKEAEKTLHPLINDCTYQMYRIRTELDKYDPKVVMKRLTEEGK